MRSERHVKALKPRSKALRPRLVMCLCLVLPVLSLGNEPDSRYYSQASSLGRGWTAVELSAGVFRWLKLEASYGATDSLDVGAWVDFQPVLIGITTFGLLVKWSHPYQGGILGLRAGTGFGIGVLGDNIAGHGIEGSGEGAQGFLYEVEATNAFLAKKTALLTLAGCLITNQRDVRRVRWGEGVNKMTYLPYLGLGLEFPGRTVDIFAVIRMTYLIRGGENYSFIFPDAKVGVCWRFGA